MAVVDTLGLGDRDFVFVGLGRLLGERGQRGLSEQASKLITLSFGSCCVGQEASIISLGMQCMNYLSHLGVSLL